ncbi:hypothetical protein HYT26_02685 [Candidatus Pacearchaeota archaeon]|nr:hypothetical protein [Candidatus Pacearchaeota archaeon]
MKRKEDLENIEKVYFLKRPIKPLEERIIKYGQILITIALFILGLLINQSIINLYNINLEIIPFEEKNTLHLYLYNTGNDMARITNYSLCWFDGVKNNTCWSGMTPEDRVVMGNPLEVRTHESQIINTEYNITKFKRLFIEMNPSKKWGIQICEIKTGCKVYVFYNDPLPSYKVIGSVLRTTITVTVQKKNQSNGSL